LLGLVKHTYKQTNKKISWQHIQNNYRELGLGECNSYLGKRCWRLELGNDRGNEEQLIGLVNFLDVREEEVRRTKGKA